MDLLRSKLYPSNYTDRVASILTAMSFGGELRIAGSAAIRSQLYAADYDGYEIVKQKGASREAALKSLAKRFQEIIRNVKAMKDVWIGDIKAGVYDDWRVVNSKSGKWNPAVAKGKVRQLLSDKIITEEESKEAIGLLNKATTKAGRIAARDGIKFHVLRWTPGEVLRGSKKMRDGSTIQLWEALGTPGITKLDTIAWLGGAEGFTDFSVIYEFIHGGVVLNPSVSDVKVSLYESLITYLHEGNYFKALKRLYAIAKFENDKTKIAKLTPILNSDLGRMYQIVSDIETLVRLLSEHSGVDAEDVREEIDNFKARLGNIYTMDGYLKAEPRILKEIENVLGMPLKEMPDALVDIGEQLDNFLQKYSKRYVEGSALRSR